MLVSDGTLLGAFAWSSREREREKLEERNGGRGICEWERVEQPNDPFESIINDTRRREIEAIIAGFIQEFREVMQTAPIQQDSLRDFCSICAAYKVEYGCLYSDVDGRGGVRQLLHLLNVLYTLLMNMSGADSHDDENFDAFLSLLSQNCSELCSRADGSSSQQDMLRCPEIGIRRLIESHVAREKIFEEDPVLCRHLDDHFDGKHQALQENHPFPAVIRWKKVQKPPETLKSRRKSRQKCDRRKTVGKKSKSRRKHGRRKAAGKFRRKSVIFL
ncbi:hypothetical protein MA16_Dca022444 [Dendrobium catenatum]|uniref:Uncharacterized protein n=1 Tax=Dendrobium catenatum TaxID=906689 RepID=A0A2I0WHU1_9ASPA|nr:hypothetical protein MA16_Dca022444 [Dendrobium catenatum]